MSLAGFTYIRSYVFCDKIMGQVGGVALRLPARACVWGGGITGEEQAEFSGGGREEWQEGRRTSESVR